MVPFRPLKFGFQFGSISVTRLSTEEEKGCVVIGIKSPKTDIQIYATKTGKIRVYKDGTELT
jgi:hypothetical protein